MQTVAIFVDGNNMDKSANSLDEALMVDYDNLVPRLIGRRSLSRFFYLREGMNISKKLTDRLHNKFYGIVKPCHKSADVPLTIEAVQLVDKVDTMIILSGDSDYIELVKYLSARGVRTEIAAFKHSASSHLIDAADFYHEIRVEDCFRSEKHREKEQAESTTKPAKKKPSPKKKRVPKDTRVIDVHDASKVGKVVSYNFNKKYYVVMLDSGTETNWKRSAFRLESEPDPKSVVNSEEPQPTVETNQTQPES